MVVENYKLQSYFKLTIKLSILTFKYWAVLASLHKLPLFYFPSRA